jgi:hypothetical protein
VSGNAIAVSDQDSEPAEIVAKIPLLEATLRYRLPSVEVSPVSHGQAVLLVRTL